MVDQKQKLKICGGCLRARYCSRHCAKLAWSGHKLICRAIQSERKAAEQRSLSNSLTELADIAVQRSITILAAIATRYWGWSSTTGGRQTRGEDTTLVVMIVCSLAQSIDSSVLILLDVEHHGGRTRLAKQVRSNRNKYGHSDMTGSVTAPNSTEAIPVPTGESVVERNLWRVIMDCNIWSSEFPYLTTLYVGDVFYVFVENGWLRLPRRQALPHCPWTEGLDAFVMRCNAKNWVPHLESFTPAIAAGVILGTSSHASFRFEGLHYGGSHNYHRRRLTQVHLWIKLHPGRWHPLFHKL